MRDDRARIRDMLDAIDNIERYTGKGREDFERGELVQTWIVHHLEIIGEAAARLAPGFRTAHSEVPWLQIIAMRNILLMNTLGLISMRSGMLLSGICLN